VTNCRWQTVPRDWPGHRESSVAKFRPHTWNRVVGAGCRVQPIACRIIVAVGVCRIGQVVWALMCVDREHHQCQLELDSVHHWQPVQLLQGRTPVIAPGQLYTRVTQKVLSLTLLTATVVETLYTIFCHLSHSFLQLTLAFLKRKGHAVKKLLFFVSGFQPNICLAYRC